MSINNLYKTILFFALIFLSEASVVAQSNRNMLLDEEWDSYSQTYNRYVNGWNFCKSGINDESIVQRANLHAYLSTGTTEGSGTTVATPWLSQVADTFSFRIYGSNLRGYTALVEFGFIPDTATISDPSDICALFIPYDTVSLSVTNQWQRTTRDMHPYYAIHGTTHRFAIRLINNHHQELYLDEIQAWIPADDTSTASCPTSLGRDFWVMFLANGGDQTPHQTILTASGDSNATITVSNPSTGWSTTTSLNANQSVQISVPLASSISEQSNTTQTKRIGLHVTSTSSIMLFAKNYKFKCNDLTLVHPSHALGTQYIMQDYMGDPSHSSVTGAEVGFVATLDNTTLTMVLPCNLINNSAYAGDTLTVNLMQGESYQLIASAPGSFSGMEVTSNGKPFAAFQGNRVAYIPLNYGGADLLYEQAVPVDYWGTDHVVVSSFGRSTDVVRITSSADDCQVYDNGAFVQTLQKGETCEIFLSGSARRITTTKKVCVGRYLYGTQMGGSPGDPASVMIPPVDLGAQHIRFNIPNASDISSHYINVVANSSDVADITLDGNNITGQFTPIDGSFSYARIAVSQGIHLLESLSGPIVADYYGLGDYAGCASLAARSYCEQELPETASCPDKSTKGRDFWAMFLYNHNYNSGYHTEEQRLYFLGDQNTTVTISNNNSGSASSTLSAPSFADTILCGTNQHIVGTVYEGGYHITSSEDIWVYADDFIDYNQDAATILPTDALGTRYIVQDYPSSNDRGAEVGFLATQNGTTLSFTVPCDVLGTSITAGTSLTINLNRGQTYMLMASANESFSGMEVTSNGKPFALFVAGQNTAVPLDGNGRDYSFEQALPVDLWGTEFIVPSTTQQIYNRLLVTASADGCTIVKDGTLLAGPLAAGQTWEGVMPIATQWHLTASSPIQVILYLGSYQTAGNIGDPSAVTIPPLDRGICDTRFISIGTPEIPSINHYVTIVCHQDLDAGLQLDNGPLPAIETVATLGDYRCHRVPLNPGEHHLYNGLGPFVAYAYGLGSWESYAYPLGIAIDSVILPPEPSIHRDTVIILDSVCQRQPYNGNGFNVSAYQTRNAGILQFSDSAIVDTFVHYRFLTLTVLPAYDTTLFFFLIPGDTLFFLNDTLTEACQRIYLLQTIHGCDSMVTLNLNYAEVSLTASNQGGCPGDPVILTAQGTHVYQWASSPDDPELASQQGQNPITVYPTVTTTYQLLDASGNVISSVTVSVEPPPTLCIETNRDFIDFDHPVLTLHDCSPDRYSSSWIFSDGYTLSGERARRQFQHPLPDTITVTLHSCNRYNCCVDTTIGFRPEIRSVWFPNVFTPDEQQNNRFGAVTSCQVAEFEIYLYNRWGLLVWHSTDIADPWDGTHEGTPVPQGAYAYRWYLKDIHGDRWSGTGVITLLR